MKLYSALIAAALAFTACDSGKPAEEETKTNDEGGGGYHGAAFRARSRAREKMDKVQETRSEQVKEEAEFDKPSPKSAE